LKTQILLLALIVIPLTSIAYAETPSHVDVYTHPFTVSVMEGGSITIHNEDTSVYRFVAWGWFEPILLNPNESVIIELPNEDCGNYCFVPDPYYFTDLITGETSILIIEAKPQPPAPVYTPPQPIPQPTQQIVQVLTNSTSANIVPTFTNSTGGIHTWCASPCADDVNEITYQNTMYESTKELTSAMEKIALLKIEVSDLKSQISNQSDLVQLQNEINTLKTERDEWKSLSEKWYNIAMDQSRIMSEFLGL